MADDNNSLESEAIKQIESAVFRKVFFVVLAGAIGFGTWVGVGGVRPDAFTGSDFQLEKEKLLEQIKQDQKEMVEECHRYVEREIKHAEILLRAEIPPVKTKAKIRALEASAARVDPEFKAVYGGW